MFLPGAVRVGYIDGKIVINPQRHELEKSDINLIVASSLQGVGNYRDNYGGYALKGSHWNTSRWNTSTAMLWMHMHLYITSCKLKKKIVLTQSQMETTLHVYSIHNQCRIYLPSSICQDIAPKVLFIKVKQYFIPQGMIYR